MSSIVIAIAAAAALFFVVNLIRGGVKVPSSIVQEKLKNGAQIVDVRTPDEFRDGAYPGARNLPLQVLQSRLSELHRDRPVVLYCASGGRSAMAARMLKQAGFTDVVNAGGLADMPAAQAA